MLMVQAFEAIANSTSAARRVRERSLQRGRLARSEGSAEAHTLGEISTMQAAPQNNDRQLESALCESELGFELIDMLAQANIDFRRLPLEELESLMESKRPAKRSDRRQHLMMSGA